MDGLRDSSALFGVARHGEAAYRVSLGLHALRHRGDRAVGLAVGDGQFVRCLRGAGSPGEVLHGARLQELPGTLAIGQVHGSLGAGGGLEGDRIVYARHRGGQIAVALSGRLSNGALLREELKEDGALLQSTSDAELLAHLIARSGQRTDINRLVDALWKVQGGWTALIASVDRLVAVRDPRGFRPLWMGQDNEVVWFATEESAIRFAGGTPVRELEPGEMAIVDPYGVHCVSPFPKQDRSGCVQEYLSVARGNGRVFGHEAWAVRQGLGERMASEAPAPRASVVVAAPGAAEAIAAGYGRVARIPVERALVLSAGGTDVPQPPAGVKDFGARMRWSVVSAAVAERSVCLITTTLLPEDGTPQAVRMLREAGATEVHLRVASPALRAACPYGVTTPTTDELVAASARGLGVDSIDHLSIEGLHAVVGKRVDDGPLYCDACLTGKHPVPPQASEDQLTLF